MSNTNDNIELFEKMPVPRAVQTMVIPAVIGQLIVLAYSIADTFFIGRTGNPYMVAAASLILPVFNITLSIASIAGVGGGAMISHLLGAKKEEEARRVSKFCVSFSILISLVFSLLTLIFMTPLLNVLGAGEQTYEFARIYAICVIVIGGLPTIMTNVFSNLVRSVGESARAGFGITLGGVINIILDPIFMFIIMPKGHEIFGAGIATMLSNCISCIYFIVIINKLKKNSVLNISISKDMPSKPVVSKVFVIGMPLAVATLLFDIDYVIIDKLMSGYSDIALAAIGIVLKAERLPLNIGIGICQGMIPLIAYNYSSKDHVRMKKIADFSLLCGILCSVLSIIIYEVFAPYVMRFFISDVNTVSIGTDFLRVRCLATMFMFISFYHVHLFNGYGRGREAMFLGVSRWIAFNIPMLFIMNHIFGMYGIVWSQLAADTLTVILSVAVHKNFLKKLKMNLI